MSLSQINLDLKELIKIFKKNTDKNIYKTQKAPKGSKHQKTKLKKSGGKRLPNLSSSGIGDKKYKINILTMTTAAVTHSEMLLGQQLNYQKCVLTAAVVMRYDTRRAKTGYYFEGI